MLCCGGTGCRLYSLILGFGLYIRVGFLRRARAAIRVRVRVRVRFRVTVRASIRFT